MWTFRTILELGGGEDAIMKDLTTEQKKALKEKLRESGLDEEGRKPVKLTLSDDEKEEMKKKLAQAEHEKLEKLDKGLHSRESKEK